MSMALVHPMLDAVLQRTPSFALVWGVWFALTLVWVWSRRRRLVMALGLSLVLALLGLASWVLQAPGPAAEWTRWGGLVAYILVVRIVGGGNSSVTDRRRIDSIARRGWKTGPFG